MLNNLMIVGRIEKEFEFEETKNGNKILNIVLAVRKPYKNINGQYENDLIPVRVPGGQMQDATAKYCKKGDIAGVSGSLQNIDGKLVVVAKKISFLSTGRNEE